MEPRKTPTGFLVNIHSLLPVNFFELTGVSLCFGLLSGSAHAIFFLEGHGMNHISLYYFTVAAEELNITRAAAKLFISQQSLSEHIRKLEKQYDAVFFTRGGRLALTNQGERMLAYAREVLEADRNLSTALLDAGQANRVRLTIGMTSTRGNVFLPEIFAAFRQRRPNAVLSIVSGNFEYIEQQYQLEKIELYTGMTSNIRTRAPADVLYRDKLYFLLSRELLDRTLGGEANAFICTHAHGVTVPDACRFPIALPPTTSTLRLVFERSFSRHGLHPDAVLETSDHDILFDLCQGGFCGCFVSRELLYRKLIHKSRPANVLIFPATDLDELSGFCMVYRKENLSPEAKTLIACSRAVTADALKKIDADLAAQCAAQARAAGNKKGSEAI